MDFETLLESHGVSFAVLVAFASAVWWCIKRLIGEKGLLPPLISDTRKTLKNTCKRNDEIVSTLQDISRTQAKHVKTSIDGIESVRTLNSECGATHAHMKEAIDSMIGCIEDIRDEIKANGTK